MPFRKVKGRTVFISDLSEKNSKDVFLINKGISLSELEATSNLPDEVLKENLVESKYGTKTDIYLLQHRPDLISKHKLKKIEVLEGGVFGG